MTLSIFIRDLLSGWSLCRYVEYAPTFPVSTQSPMVMRPAHACIVPTGEKHKPYSRTGLAARWWSVSCC